MPPAHLSTGVTNAAFPSSIAPRGMNHHGKNVQTYSLFALIEAPSLLDDQQLRERIARMKIPPDRHDDLIQILLWYGVIGILRKSGEETYIYNANYEMKKLSALVSKRPTSELVYIVNRAFWRGLDIEAA
jgi:hypothetical protein